jgi:hypothetical protein
MMKFISSIFLTLSLTGLTIGAAVPEARTSGAAKRPTHKKLVDGHYKFKLSPNGTIVGKGVLISAIERPAKKASDGSPGGHALTKRFPGTVDQAVNFSVFPSIHTLTRGLSSRSS